MDTKDITLGEAMTEKELNTQEVLVRDSIEESVNDANTVCVIDNKGKYVYKAPDKRTIVFTMILSFFVPAIVMVLALYNTQIYPGGINTLLTYDMKSQFLPIYASMRYLGHSQHSVLYTFFGALGNNSLPNYSTYLVNPLSWITVLFSLEQLPDVIYYLTIFRIGLGGLGFSTYLLFGKKKNRERRYPLAVFLLSCCYALMSFSIMYSLCMNWLDIVALLPIMLLGIERIIEGKKGAIYIFTLTYALLNSFQLSYMAGIFMTMYLIYRLVEEKKENWIKLVLRFGLDSLCALGLTMPIFLPMLKSMMGGRTTSEMSAASTSAYFYYPLWEVIKQLGSCQYDKISTGGLPSLFCGSLSVLLALLAFGVSRQNISSKVVAAIMICLYFASFCVIPLNKAWHGFMEPYCFPGRYSYTFSCFLLIFAYNSMVFVYNKICAPNSVLSVVGALVVLLVLGEQYMNAAYIISSHNVELNYKSKEEYCTYVAQIQDILDNTDDGFYRISRGDSYFSVNDGMIFGYNGMCYFSSFFDRNYMDFLGTLGFSQNEHVLYDIGGTPLTESFFGIKYRIVRPYDSLDYKKVYENDSPYGLYQNENVLPLGFIMGAGDKIANGGYIFVEEDSLGNAFLYQEIMLSEALGEQCDVYEGIKYTLEDIDDENARHVIVEFEIDDEKPVWVFFKTPTKEELDSNIVDEDSDIDGMTLVNGERINHIRTDLSTICTCLGTFKKGEKVRLETYDRQYFGNPWIVYFDSDACNAALEKISENSFEVTKCINGVISGKISAPNQQSYMMITLPYMDGYSIKIDGILTDYKDYRGVLLLVPMKEGEHFIEISFSPPGFKEGLIIFFVSLICTAIVLVYSRRLQEK